MVGNVFARIFLGENEYEQDLFDSIFDSLHIKSKIYKSIRYFKRLKAHQ
jgi:hypothetical protein